MSEPSLEDLATEAKGHPPKSLARRHALTMLISQIDERLSKGRKSNLPPDVRE